MPALPRLNLIQSPTPLHRLDRMSAKLGIDLWIKRDDLTGFAMGGNKGRKLEYLMADALAKSAEVVVTCGSLQSNFVRQLGAAASTHRIKCAAAVMELPFDGDAGRPTGPYLQGTGGNRLLDDLLGVDLRVYADGTWDELFLRAEELAMEYESTGLNVYRIPVGGSSPLGAYAFFEAAGEVAEQAFPFDAIVVASSSGSTQTGLAYAFADSSTRVVGIACDDEPLLVNDFADLSAGLHALVGTKRDLKPHDFELHLDWVGGGYGVPSEAGNAAIVELARTEGIFLDPIYSGKAFAGLVGLAERNELQERVLFWHTGGTPTLFAM
jgi:D-cysteine desulfhydrase family pyridoxal phosphate-dependent enzyme